MKKNNKKKVFKSILLMLVTITLFYFNGMDTVKAAYPSTDFDCTQTIQSYTAEFSGIYKLEVWGAQGGGWNDTYHGGYGGYSTGNVLLTEGTILYINVGGQGETVNNGGTKEGGYNGGGSVQLTWGDGNEQRRTGQLCKSI